MNGFAMLLIVGIISFATGFLNGYISLGMIGVGAIGLLGSAFFGGSKR